MRKLQKITMKDIVNPLNDPEMKMIYGGGSGGGHDCSITITCLSGAQLTCGGVTCNYGPDGSSRGFVSCRASFGSPYRTTWCSVSGSGA